MSWSPKILSCFTLNRFPLFCLFTTLAACGGGGGESAAPDDNQNVTVTLTEDQSVTFTVQLDTCDNYNIVTPPDFGHAGCENGEITYTPDRNYSGDDYFEYKSFGTTSPIYKVSLSIEPSPVDTVSKVVIAENSVCALLTNGAISCFGKSTLELVVPSDLVSPSDISSGYHPIVGFSHVCVIDENQVKCDGGWVTDIPTDIYNPTALYGAGVYNCALHDYGLSCWGELGSLVIPTVTDPTSISASFGHMCVIDGGLLSCSGTSEESYGTQVPPLSNPTLVVTGNTSTCAIDEGTVVCWGLLQNSGGGVQAMDLTPAAFVNPVDIAVGSAHACAIDDTGVVCWGINNIGSLEVPENIVNPTKIFAHQDTTCVIDQNGLICWIGYYFPITVPVNLYSAPQ